MRAVYFACLLLIAAAAAEPAAAEITYPWCRLGTDGGTNCGFSSFEQCGGGAYCVQNPQYQGPPSKPAPTARRRR